MDFNTYWDIDQYRTKFECEEHWALKRDFMLAHKNSFPEDRLVCLAQLFVNIELLRCTYPMKVMTQVSILAKEIGHDYKERHKKTLQRTFVKASDAANAKARGEKRSYAQANKEKDTAKNLKSVSLHKQIKWLPEKESEDSPMATSQKRLDPNSSCQASINKYLSLAKNFNHSKEKISPRITAIRQRITCPPSVKVPETVHSLLDNDNPLSKIVLLTHSYDKSVTKNYYNILQGSIGFSKMSLVDEYQETGSDRVCHLYTDNRIAIGTGNGCTKKEAKQNASKNALKNLLKICICCKVLKVCSSDGEVSLDQLGVIGLENDDQGKLSDNNVGARLMKLMGWSGGALGKAGVGITEPIKESTVYGRSGLGLGKEEGINKNFINTVRRLIYDYMSKEGVSDLVFSSDLSNIQRKEIHKQALKIGGKRLKSSSYGKGKDRFLVVSWKMNQTDVLQTILNQGGKTDKYELFKPNTLAIDDL